MSKQKFLSRPTLRCVKNITNFTALRGSEKLHKVYTNNNEIYAVRFPSIGTVRARTHQRNGQLQRNRNFREKLRI
jgi:hypothetical protein